MMLVAFELKMPLRDVYEKMDQEEVGWWLAFLRLKQEREKVKNRPRGRGTGTPVNLYDA